MIAPSSPCGPCLYEQFEQHRDGCPICRIAPTGQEFCTVGLALLDEALGDAGLPTPPPTNAVTRDLTEVTLSALGDELRQWSALVWVSPTNQQEVRPWGAPMGDTDRRRTAQLFMTINAGVRLGLISDWKAAPA